MTLDTNEDKNRRVIVIVVIAKVKSLVTNRHKFLCINISNICRWIFMDVILFAYLSANSLYIHSMDVHPNHDKLYD
jgi:hypothetical protein